MSCTTNRFALGAASLLCLTLASASAASASASVTSPLFAARNGLQVRTIDRHVGMQYAGLQTSEGGVQYSVAYHRSLALISNPAAYFSTLASDASGLEDEGDPSDVAGIWNPISGGVSGCLLSGCVLSGCFGSLCGLSGCAGSACTQSGCLGTSVCAQSACSTSGCTWSWCGLTACQLSYCGGRISLCGGSGCSCPPTPADPAVPNEASMIVNDVGSLMLAIADTGADEGLGLGDMLHVNGRPAAARSVRAGSLVRFITADGQVREETVVSVARVRTVRDGRTESRCVLRSETGSRPLPIETSDVQLADAQR